MKPRVHESMAVASIALGAFAMVTSEFLPIGLLGSIAHELGVADGLAGLMVTVPGVTAAVAAPASAALAGRIERRKVLLALCALMAASNLLVATAPGFATLLAGRILLGLCVGGFWAFAVVVARRLVPQSSSNRATAIVLAGISAGTVMGVPLATAIGGSVGWRGAFLVVALLALAAGLAQLVLLPRLPALPAARGSQRGTVGTLLRNRLLLTGLSAAALVAGGHFVAYTYIQLFLSRSAGLNGVQVSVTLAVYGLAGLVGTFGGERLAARGLRFAFVVVSVLLAAAVGALAVTGTQLAPVWLAITAWGLAFGAVPVCVQLWVFHAAPEQAETGAALTVTVFQVALAGGAGAGGWLLDHGGLHVAYAAGAALAMSAGLLLVSVRPAGGEGTGRSPAEAAG